MINISSQISTSHIEEEQLKNFIGQTVKIHGTVYKIREMSGFAFVILKMKKTLLQCVYSNEYSKFALSELCDNMSVVINGEVIKDERSHAGIEVRLLSFECLSLPAQETPVVINNKEVAASIETLLDYRPITLRNAKERAIFQIQAGICRGFRKFFDENGFTEIHSPKIVFGGAEGGANIFKLDYFGREAYLTQSPQFYKQIMAGVFERVYEIAPVFRAEKHDTSRHVNEYTSVDLEMGFIENFYDIMRLETKMLAETTDFLREHYAAELALLKTDVPVITEIPAVTFSEAKNMIAKTYKREITDSNNFKDFDDFYNSDDFAPEEEKLLCDIIKKETNCEFVFVTHYKSSKRPFYTMDSYDNPDFPDVGGVTDISDVNDVTESFDLLFRGMEITTGGQRIHDYQMQISKMKRLGMNTKKFSSYLMAHKHGLPPHGGLGLGLERFTAKLLNYQNIRFTTLFPRDIIRLEP